MRNAALVVVVAVVVALSLSLPASAATFIQLRYTSTSNNTWNNAGISFIQNFDSNLWGFTVRRSFMNDTWALSFNYDSGSFTAATSWTTPGQYNRFWNLNVHRQWVAGNGMFSVFAGYASTAVVFPNWYGPGVEAAIRQTGLRVGGDAMIRFGQNWYAVGSAGFGPFGSAQDNGFVGFSSTPATFYNYHVGVGRTFADGRWALEGGWRGMHWAFNQSLCGGSPCAFRWGGWYGGLNAMLP